MGNTMCTCSDACIQDRGEVSEFKMSNDELDTYMNLSDRGLGAQIVEEEVDPDAIEINSVANAKTAALSKHINKYEDDFTELVWETDTWLEITAAK